MFITENNVDTTKVRVGIEYFAQYATDERINEAISSGLPVSVVGTENYEHFVSLGVSEFTDMSNPSYGLNW